MSFVITELYDEGTGLPTLHWGSNAVARGEFSETQGEVVINEQDATVVAWDENEVIFIPIGSIDGPYDIRIASHTEITIYQQPTNLYLGEEEGGSFLIRAAVTAGTHIEWQAESTPGSGVFVRASSVLSDVSNDQTEEMLVNSVSPTDPRAVRCILINVEETVYSDTVYFSEVTEYSHSFADSDPYSLGGFTLSRTTIGTGLTDIGAIQSKQTNQAVFIGASSTGANVEQGFGLLLEAARTNYAHNSQDLSGYLGEALETTGGPQGPNTLATEAFYTNNTGSAAWDCYPNAITQVAGETYVNTIYLAEGTLNWVQIWAEDGGYYSNVDLATGAVTQNTGGSTFFVTTEEAGYGFWKITATLVAANSGNYSVRAYLLSGDTASAQPSWSPGDTLYVLFDHWQIEQGLFPTSNFYTDGFEFSRAKTDLRAINTSLTNVPTLANNYCGQLSFSLGCDFDQMPAGVRFFDAHRSAFADQGVEFIALNSTTLQVRLKLDDDYSGRELNFDVAGAEKGDIIDVRYRKRSSETVLGDGFTAWVEGVRKIASVDSSASHDDAINEFVIGSEGSRDDATYAFMELHFIRISPADQSDYDIERWPRWVAPTPVITLQPLPLDLDSGAGGTMSTESTGPKPITYYWEAESTPGNNIYIDAETALEATGGDSPNLVISSVDEDDAGRRVRCKTSMEPFDGVSITTTVSITVGGGVVDPPDPDPSNEYHNDFTVGAVDGEYVPALVNFTRGANATVTTLDGDTVTAAIDQPAFPGARVPINFAHPDQYPDMMMVNDFKNHWWSYGTNTTSNGPNEWNMADDGNAYHYPRLSNIGEPDPVIGDEFAISLSVKKNGSGADARLRCRNSTNHGGLTSGPEFTLPTTVKRFSINHTTDSSDGGPDTDDMGIFFEAKSAAAVVNVYDAMIEKVTDHTIKVASEFVPPGVVKFLSTTNANSVESDSEWTQGNGTPIVCGGLQLEGGVASTATPLAYVDIADMTPLPAEGLEECAGQFAFTIGQDLSAIPDNAVFIELVGASINDKVTLRKSTGTTIQLTVNANGTSKSVSVDVGATVAGSLVDGRYYCGAAPRGIGLYISSTWDEDTSPGAFGGNLQKVYFGSDSFGGNGSFITAMQYRVLDHTADNATIIAWEGTTAPPPPDPPDPPTTPGAGYASLRAETGTANVTLTDSGVAGTFVLGSDPNGNGDDGGMVIKSDVHSGYWVRQCAQTLADPIQLNWFEVVEGQNISPLFKQLISDYGPVFRVKMPSTPMELTWGDSSTYDFYHNGGIHTFALLESAVNTSIRFTHDALEVAWLWGERGNESTMQELILGSDTPAATRDDHTLTLIGPWRFDNISVLAGANNNPYYMFEHGQKNGYVHAQFRVNTKWPKAATFYTYGSGGTYDVTYGGRHQGGSLHSGGTQTGYIHYEDVWVDDSAGKGLGWTGSSSSGNIDHDNRGFLRSAKCINVAHGNSNRTNRITITGKITCAYGNSGYNFFLHDYIGTSASDPFVMDMRDYGWSGPNDFNKPAGVKIGPKEFSSNYHPSKSDGFGADQAYQRFIHFKYRDTWGETDLSDRIYLAEADNNDTGGSTAVYSSFVTYTWNLSRGYMYTSPGGANPDRASDNIHQGDGINPAIPIQYYDKSEWRCVTCNFRDTVRYGQFGGVLITKDGNEPSAYGQNHIGPDVTINNRITVLSGSGTNTGEKITFWKTSGEIINVASGTTLNITDMWAEPGVTIGGSGTVRVNGTVRSGTWSSAYNTMSKGDFIPDNPLAPAEIT